MRPASPHQRARGGLGRSRHDGQGHERPGAPAVDGGPGKEQKRDRVHRNEEADHTPLPPPVHGPRAEGIDERATDRVGRCHDAGEGVGAAKFAHHEHDAQGHHRDGETGDEGG